MFERYTEKARRVIFFARYEASMFGSPYIETEHVLLGLLREDPALTSVVLPSAKSIDAIRTEVEERTSLREKTSTSVDLPLSNESKRVLAYAAEEAERFGHKHIGSEHLLLGLLSEKGAFAAYLRQLARALARPRSGNRFQKAAHERASARRRGASRRRVGLGIRSGAIAEPAEVLMA